MAKGCDEDDCNGYWDPIDGFAFETLSGELGAGAIEVHCFWLYVGVRRD